MFAKWYSLTEDKTTLWTLYMVYAVQWQNMTEQVSILSIDIAIENLSGIRLQTNLFYFP